MTAPTQAYVEALTAHVPASRLERGVRLAPYTTFRIGGPADLLYRARTPDELVTVIQAARDADIPHFLLGRGANILVGDGGVRGLVVRSEVKGVELVDDTAVRAGAGVITYPDLIEHTVSRGLGGIHHYVGIPSTVGGALWQNLHFLSPAPERARTMFIEEVLEAAEILTEEGYRAHVGVEYFEFGYDQSILHHRRDVVLTATFRLRPTPVTELRRVWDENLTWRAARHPDLEMFPSAGSIFRKVEGVGAGRLIDECGLKGTVLGGAGIYEKHANIIVNLGGATATDVRGLIDLVQETVARETGQHLVPEIGFVGEFA
jgi:UDP-N-acetylmuramate dehydrogenase